MTAPLTPRKKIVAVVVYCFFAMSGMAMIAVGIRVFVWTLRRMPTGGIVLVGCDALGPRFLGGLGSMGVPPPMTLTPRQQRFFVDDDCKVAMPPGWTPYQLLKDLYDEGLPPPREKEIEE